LTRLKIKDNKSKATKYAGVWHIFYRQFIVAEVQGHQVNL